MQSALWFLVLILIHAQTYHECHADEPPILSCNDLSALSGAFVQCFINARVEISHDAQMSSVSDIFFYPMGFICNQKANLKAGASCGLEIERQCHGNDFVPTSSSVNAVIDDLCQDKQRTNINDTCRLQIHEEYWTCVSAKEGSADCSGFQAMNECFVSEYANCGCLTAQIFSDNFIQLLKSTSCDVASMERVDCRDGGASMVGPALLSLAMANVVWYFVGREITWSA